MDQFADIVSLSNQIEQLHKHTDTQTHTSTATSIGTQSVLYSHRVFHLIREVFGMGRSEPDSHFWIHLGTWETLVITIPVELRKCPGHHGDFVQEVSKASSSVSGLVDSAESSAEERTVRGEGERDSGFREVAIAVDILTQQRHLLHPLWYVCAGYS